VSERRNDQEARDRLEAIQDGYDRLRRITYRALIFFAITFVVTTWLVVHLIGQNSQANAALCTFRGDLEHRVTATENYLREHPEGFPGVSAATLQSSLNGQRRTVRALGSLDC
jgi:hypothetical protein